jgi:hypothetical protein
MEPYDHPGGESGACGDTRIYHHISEIERPLQMSALGWAVPKVECRLCVFCRRHRRHLTDRNATDGVIGRMRPSGFAERPTRG